MSVWVRNSKGRLETTDAFFGSLFDTPTSSPTSSIMAEEREVVPPEAPRRTMYQLLHPTQSSIPSCIMFPPNAPHVEIKQGLMAILPDFRGLENENPFVHVRVFEEVIGSFYAQNVIETAKLKFFPFSLKDKAKGWLYTLKPRNRISTTTSSGSVFRLREEDNMSAKISLLTKEIEALKLKGSRGVNAVYREEPMEIYRICQRDRSHHKCLNFDTSHTTSSSSKPPLEDVLYTFLQKQGEQNQRFETMFTRINEEMRETKSQIARLTDALSRTERGKLPSQTQPNPNNQSAKVVNTENFEEIKSATILRSGKEIGKGAPKANEKSKETPAKKDESGIAKSNDIEKCPFLAPFPQALKLPKNLDVTNEILEHLHQVKVNLPLLHIIKQMPLYAKVIKDLCTVKRKHHVKKTAFLTEMTSISSPSKAICDPKVAKASAYWFSFLWACSILKSAEFCFQFLCQSSIRCQRWFL
uniref:Retrotransposon gag domain-containing protein n=1 Tax=Fagus sylvatica TaxID=28930 RepID=A0A2N9IEQ6_FAGSY